MAVKLFRYFYGQIICQAYILQASLAGWVQNYIDLFPMVQLGLLLTIPNILGKVSMTRMVHSARE